MCVCPWRSTGTSRETWPGFEASSTLPPVYLRPFCEQSTIHSPKVNSYPRNISVFVRSGQLYHAAGLVLYWSLTISCCDVEGDIHALHPTRLGAWQNRHCVRVGVLLRIPWTIIYIATQLVGEPDPLTSKSKVREATLA
jgi:hypothetical protein